MASQINPTVLFVMRLIVGGVFLITGALKVRDPEAFSISIQAYRLVSFGVAAAVATYLPWLEIVVGAAVLAGWKVAGAAASVAALSAVFMAAIGSAWVRGLDIACGCFGGAGSGAASYPWHILGNAALFVMALILVRRGAPGGDSGAG